MNRIPVRLLVLAATTLAVLTLTAPAQAAPYCGIAWGSQPEASWAGDAERLNDVRAGRHACFDRLVIDIGGQDATFGSYDVRYVPLVREDGSGHAVPVRGAADLQIVLGAAAYDQYGHPTLALTDPQEMVDVTGYRTFRQVAWAGSFEATSTIALGVRARLPFRVFPLPGTPNSGHTPRLVIDVAHSW